MLARAMGGAPGRGASAAATVVVLAALSKGRSGVLSVIQWVVRALSSAPGVAKNLGPGGAAALAAGLAASLLVLLAPSELARAAEGVAEPVTERVQSAARMAVVAAGRASAVALQSVTRAAENARAGATALVGSALAATVTTAHAALDRELERRVGQASAAASLLVERAALDPDMPPAVRRIVRLAIARVTPRIRAAVSARLRRGLRISMLGPLQPAEPVGEATPPRISDSDSGGDASSMVTSSGRSRAGSEDRGAAGQLRLPATLPPDPGCAGLSPGEGGAGARALTGSPGRGVAEADAGTPGGGGGSWLAVARAGHQGEARIVPRLAPVPMWMRQLTLGEALLPARGAERGGVSYGSEGRGRESALGAASVGAASTAAGGGEEAAPTTGLCGSDGSSGDGAASAGGGALRGGGSSRARAAAVWATARGRWLRFRAWVLYTLAPFDRSLWACTKDPLWWGLHALGATPVLGQLWWVVVFLMHDRRDEGRVADFIVTFESSSFLSVGMYALVSGAATLLACSAWMPEHVPCDSATVPDSRWISGWAAESAGQWARGVVEGLRWGGGAEAEGALPLAGAAGTCPACAVYGTRASVMDAVFFLVQATLVLASFAMLPYTSRLSHRRGGRADASSDGEGGRAPAALQDDGAADKPSALLRPWYGAHPRVRGGELQQLLWYFTVVTLACASAVAAVFLVGGVTWRTLATAYWIRCAFGLLALPFALFKIPVIGPMLLLRSDPTGYDRDGRVALRTG